MKNILKYTIILLVFITTKSIAQTPDYIVKEDNYTVIKNEILIAKKRIILKPQTLIKAGSTFVAKISSGADPEPDPNPNPDPEPEPDPVVNVPEPYIPIAFSNENYIYTRKFQTPMAAVSGIKNSNDVSESITYFDGLGRPMQSIAIKASPDNKDIVTHIGYDGFGRQEKEYLPYLDTGGAFASYRENASESANNYYLSKYPIDISNGDSNPFSKKQFENSPLNRVLKQAAPGTSWAMGNGHEIKFDYQANTTADAVKLYRANTNWEASKGVYEIWISEEDTYAENELYKNITYDENSNANPSETSGSTIEFKNKEGQIILKRTYNSGDRHDTYYVYDIYGNLTYVLPPKVSGAISDEALDGLCYQYKYDNRNRLAEKKLPGKQWEFIVYDKLDRPVATGPAFSPFKDDNSIGWIITKYDAFSRPVYTGWVNQSSNSETRKSLQDQQNKAEVLFEIKQTSGTIDGIAVNYANNIAPTNFKLLTVNYYDDYVFPNVSSIPTTIEGGSVLKNTKGLTTGSWARVVTTSQEKLGETTTTFYDTKARPIRTHLQNYLSGYTISDSKLDFSGKTLYTLTRHKRSSGDNELVIREEFKYSPQDRLLTHKHQINGGQVQLMADNTYDDLGQLIAKNVGNTTGNPLQKIDFTYNIRGWLTGINNIDNLQQGTDPLDLFAFKINYNNKPGNSEIKALFNGNIAETFWKTASDQSLRNYGYQYDNLNRLTDALYGKPNDAIPASGAYNESLSYDKNGNIKSLERNGASDAPSIVFQIDDLKYDYADENSNQLAKVTEGFAGNDHAGFIDGNKTGDDYSYDKNGNMTSDKNKNITEITYNQLNLPKKITFGSNGTIEYIYSATGQKLEKIVTENNVVSKTNYLGGFQYKNNVLEFFPMAEGYVKNDNGLLSYVFQYKDHLGNIRVSYTKNAQNVAEIIEENNYYPFGLKHQGYNDYVATINKYKYNGKELQDELGLNFYDYGARNYDPALGRWMNIDPLAEQGRRWSPYNYVMDNPVYFIDPDGMWPWPPVLFNANSVVSSIKAWKTGWEKSYNEKTANHDIAGAAFYAFSAAIENLNTSKGRKKEAAGHDDIGGSVTSKNGGNENPTTDGKKKGGDWDADAFMTAAPGGEKTGNKYKKATDYVQLVNDAFGAFDLGGKAGEKTKEAVKELNNKETKSEKQTTTFNVEYDKKTKEYIYTRNDAVFLKIKSEEK